MIIVDYTSRPNSSFRTMPTQEQKIHDIAVAYAQKEYEALQVSQGHRVASGQYGMFCGYYNDMVKYCEKTSAIFDLSSVPVPPPLHKRSKPRSESKPE